MYNTIYKKNGGMDMRELTKEQEEFLQEIHDLYFQSDFDMLMEHLSEMEM